MDYTQFTQIISTVGFPIAVCCVMFYIADKFLVKFLEVLQEFVKVLQKIDAKLDILISQKGVEN